METKYIESILDRLSETREYLEFCWTFSHMNYIKHGSRFFLQKMPDLPCVSSAVMCRHTSLFLLMSLEAAGDNSWQVKGGYLKIPKNINPKMIDFYGNAVLKDAYGNKKIEHYWLESDGVILDLTSDQVGYEPIIYIDKKDVKNLGIADRYEIDAKKSKRGMVTSLKRTVYQWYGHPGSIYMEQDPYFKNMKNKYAILSSQNNHPVPSMTKSKKS